MSLSIRSAASLVTFEGDGPLRGEELRSASASPAADVNCDGGVVTSLGAPEASKDVFDATGCTLVPGFVDPHTHLPFYGWRADEDAARLQGTRYETIHAEEGGIFRSARLLREASDDEVLDFSLGVAASMLRNGTTTFEMKSGYGLEVEQELRQLRLAKEIAARVPQTTRTTCLAAHAVPKGETQGSWVGKAAAEVVAVAAAESLATACDIYVETIAFYLEHAARLATAAEEHGLDMRVHADQLADNQTASFAARWNFRSADHLNHTSPEGVADLADSETAAVLLPGATFTLMQAKKPPARDLVDSGAIVALGSDFNPGTSPVHSMPFVIALACRTYGLRPFEALAAATVNAAYVLRLEDEIGRIQEGRRADIVVLDAPSFDHVTYRPDLNHVAAVVCGGELVYVAPGAEGRVKRA
jgi:imidazolonepropionase